ncbi:MAG: TylF/MycF family methyltransferase [Prevotellaceae bacterium]|jgi:O-methyltransferase|nr:TylF/MycF family methyltransferase [Prevotellaceae bacterium]
MKKILRYAHKIVAKILSKHRVYIISLRCNSAKMEILCPQHDTMRLAILCLCSDEIKRKALSGNVAELGVYRGEFASKINQLFPDKMLYLFDTFEGFDDKDIVIESQNNFSSATDNGKEKFSNTNIDLVLKAMKYPQKCIVKQGFFPKTAEGLEDKFCFVNLDADLYEPILQGLKFFYPRLEKGGYILIHDYNSNEYKGAKEAMCQFCKSENITFLPLPDAGGSAIICK